ncbi:NlpC/P60 family protein [Mesorhizobium sp. M0843]|uniref:NlpC/P60 family protein n=1 Tax=Mesorhizobium sp. M0843 TaxID=2957010 RepID=UPI0033383852
MNYQHLLGRKFAWGSQDCFGLMRDFYSDVFGIELPNIARPEDFYQKGLNLFGENYRSMGFKEIQVHPSEIKFGDVIVAAIGSTFGNHCGTFVENGRILHHLYGGLSQVSPFRGIMRNNCIAIYRHQDVPSVVVTQAETRDLRDFLSPSKQKLLDELRAAHSGTQAEADGRP